MSEKCHGMKCCVVCGAHCFGALLAILAAIFRIAHLSVMTIGPKSLAVAAGLLLLFSIASSLCCCGKTHSCSCQKDAPGEDKKA